MLLRMQNSKAGRNTSPGYIRNLTSSNKLDTKGDLVEILSGFMMVLVSHNVGHALVSLEVKYFNYMPINIYREAKFESCSELDYETMLGKPEQWRKQAMF